MNLEKDKLKNEAWQVKRHNKKTVKELMTNLNEWLFDNFLNYFKQNEPNMKRLLDIPELKEIELQEIGRMDKDHIRMSFELNNFEWSLRQLLLKNWFKKDDVKSWKDWIRIILYGANLQIVIKT